MKIKSINDVITNSSDEVYIIKSNKTAQEILDDLRAHHNKEEYHSGMGGILTVKTHDDFVGNDEDYSKGCIIPNGYAEVTIDNGYKTLLNYVSPMHDEGIEDTIAFSDNIIWYLRYLTGESLRNVTKETIEAIPECKDNLKEIINKLNELYENFCNN